MATEDNKINIYGARVHNLKNIDVSIPRDSLTVITGLSGSGKSSLLFDTLYAEGQRRYIETFSSYARGFLGGGVRPDVEGITGLSPVISIEQKTTNKNPRSTVGTITEIYDLLRLLFARGADAYSWVTGERMVKYTEEQVAELIQTDYAEKRIQILAPVVKGRKGHYKELFESLRKKGYLYCRVDGKLTELTPGISLDRYKIHNIEVVIDKMKIRQDEDGHRLRQSVQNAMVQGDGLLMISELDTGKTRCYSKRLMCPTSGIAYKEPSPGTFSFNSPEGACPLCKGLGIISRIDPEKIMPVKNLSISEGGIAPLGKKRTAMIFWQIEALLERYECTLDTPVGNLPEEAVREILYGRNERLRIRREIMHAGSDYFVTYEGLESYFLMHPENEPNDKNDSFAKWVNQFSETCKCPECGGSRLNKEALSYRIHDKNISQLAEMDLNELNDWLNGLQAHLTSRQKNIAGEILKELSTRLSFLLNVGLEYLSLSRSSATLSGGESQRIRLATHIGSGLVGVLYVLDEPSIGLHGRDNKRLIQSLKNLRDAGNTVVVVEHDKEIMLAADYLIDMGPFAGRLGGEVLFQGTPAECLKESTLTAEYLSGKRYMELPASRRKGNGHSIRIYGASGNNLKQVNVEFPLGKLILVTGVSGSGKSTLVNETLRPILTQKFYRSQKTPLPYERIEGTEFIDKIIDVDQSPIGRTPRSNPATYTDIFTEIRNLFTQLPESKIRGYKPGRFSFNTGNGRCEVCGGNGYRTIEMNFLPDVMVKCEACNGKRYNRETLEVRYKGKSIAEVLDMTINQAVDFFANIPHLVSKIKVLQDVGLGYIKLGQPSTTLSGGESQRIKLAAELARPGTGKTLYILDEPTTGLHFEDIRMLMNVLNRLVDKGNTVIVIEHNMDVIKMADYIIDMGPEGGRGGGELLSCGTPEEIALSQKGYTPMLLREELSVN